MLTPSPLPLTRAANLCDFDGICPSVAVWQQAHARDTYTRWRAFAFAPKLTKDLRAVCVNWGAARFTVPCTTLQAEYYDLVALPGLVDASCAAIYALSVLDRVDAPLRILRQCSQALVPGGLLLASFALWNAHGDDCAVGHELRQRIYDRASWKKLLHEVRHVGLAPFGGVDLRYPGDALGDHTLGTVVLVKERG